MPAAVEPRVFERGDHYYFVTPVSPLDPSENEIEEFAFAEQLRNAAPNEALLWLRGQYVEADRPNLNGQMWTADELAIKKLTPMFMPVTVMHDPRTAVGLIADIALLTPEANKVPRSRLDSTLGVWSHRFPEVAEEAVENYKQGILMQSMEAISPAYSCSECGQMFHKLPEGAERENWCEHLKGTAEFDNSWSSKSGENRSAAARILSNVTFTGTGLIFGTRGAKGAYREAHLDINAEEIAEFHQEAHDRTSKDRPTRKKTDTSARKVRNVETVEISRSEYDDLRQAKDERDSLRTKVTEAEQAKAETESKVEQMEQAKNEAENKLEKAEKDLEEAKEAQEKADLASERITTLGKGFLGKLGEFARGRLNEQAKSFSDEEWDDRLKELEELSGLKRDDKGDGNEDDDDANGGKGGGSGTEFSKEEIARAGVGSGRENGDGANPSPEARRSVVGGLISSGK